MNFIQKRSINIKKLSTIIVFLLFVFMMLFNLMHSSLWGDEWGEWVISQIDILDPYFYKRIVGTFQPPLYNVLMHFWLKVSTNIVWFRLFNVAIGMGGGTIL